MDLQKAKAMLESADVIHDEGAVQKAVERLSHSRTVIIVAHRLATVKKADRIVVFEAGRIVAEGTHEALVAEGGLYARLARLQFTDGALSIAEATD